MSSRGVILQKEIQLYLFNHIFAGVLEIQDMLRGGGQIVPPPRRNRVLKMHYV